MHHIAPVAFVIGLCALVWKLLQVGKRDPRLPPGPPTVPILGNAHILPPRGLGRKFQEWAKIYGSVFSLKVGSATMIVLGDPKSAYEVLVAQGNNTSDRPPNFVSKFITQGDHIIIENLGPVARIKRGIMQRTLLPKEMDTKHYRTQEAESSVLIRNLIERPEDWYTEVRRYTASVITSLTFGHRAPDTKSFWYNGVYNVMHEFVLATEPGANPPIDQFPFLAWVPASLAFWKRRAIHAKETMDSTWTESRQRVERRREQGDKRNSIMDAQLDEFEKKGWPEGLTQHAFDLIFGELVGGGADTTASSIQTLVLAFAKFPHIQERARREIDAVCGTERSPLFSDFEQMPYINCIIKEGQRWRPPGTIGLPHCIKEDMWYEGMLLPAGAMVFVAVLNIHNDDSNFPDPSTFNPDRYTNHSKLANEYATSKNYTNRDHYNFGSGRRLCPGIHFAERSMWRIAAKLLWAYEFAPEVDPETGKEEVLGAEPEDYTEGTVIAPKPFRVKITPRSKEHMATIEREYQESLEYLENFAE